MPQFRVSYHGSGDDEVQVTADNAEHAREVFDEEYAINLWPEDIEITDVELVPNEPDPPPSTYLRQSVRVTDLDPAMVQDWLAKLATLEPHDHTAFKRFSISQWSGDWQLWAGMEHEGE